MTMDHQLDPTILREYDIRGVVGETLGEADLRVIGQGFATIARDRTPAGRNPKICVGRDGRLSSPMLEAALVEGLCAGGVDVVRIGVGPTPMLYFSVYDRGGDGGIMITGSHNPPDYNGVKMMLGHAPFYGADIVELGRIVGSGALAEGSGTPTDDAVIGDYVDRLLHDAGTGDLKVAWDAGNGAAGDALTKLVERLPGRHLLLNATIDGTFPAHHPDPTIPANLAQLIETVRTEKCDLGIAFDGDGDRIGVVDETGEILWGDQIRALMAREILREQPGATIIADVKASQVLFDEIARLGGSPLMWITGHSVIKAKMAELKAPLAGEMSGHIFFADHYYGFDDALYAGVRMLRLVAGEGRSLASMKSELPRRLNTPEIRFDCPDARKFAVVEEVRSRLEGDGARFSGIDGVRVQTDDGWWLLRASNTQPVLVARCEAEDASGLSRLKSALEHQLRTSGVEPPAF
jgi:phosphomannomutase